MQEGPRVNGLEPKLLEVGVENVEVCGHERADRARLSTALGLPGGCHGFERRKEPSAVSERRLGYGVGVRFEGSDFFVLEGLAIGHGTPLGHARCYGGNGGERTGGVNVLAAPRANGINGVSYRGPEGVLGLLG